MAGVINVGQLLLLLPTSALLTFFVLKSVRLDTRDDTSATETFKPFQAMPFPLTRSPIHINDKKMQREQVEHVQAFPFIFISR